MIRLLLLIVTLATLLLSGGAWAQTPCPPIPFIFQQGAPFNAPQVNTNFSHLRECINGINLGITGGRLFAPANQFYVSKTGNDANDCLGPANDRACLTINRGLAAAFNYDAHQASMVINVGAGTFLENITVSGNVPGLVSSQLWASQRSSPQVVIKGGGSAATIVQGVPEIAGQGYCYTVLAVNGAYLALENLAVRSDTPGPCQQSNLYVQLATMYILADVKLLAATGNHVMLEESANFYITPGYQNVVGLILAGDANYGMVASANSNFTSDSSIVIQDGPLTMRNGLMIYSDDHSSFKLWAGNPAFKCFHTVSEVSCAGQIVGRRFGLYGNSFMMVGFAPDPWPGTIGLVADGSRYRAPDNQACVGSASNCPQNTTAWLGLGAGSTVGVSTGSGSYGGFAELTAGTGAASAGSIYIGFPYELSRGVCAVTRANGIGLWNPRVAFAVNGFSTAEGLAIGWDNNGVALTTGENYFLGWVCQTGQ